MDLVDTVKVNRQIMKLIVSKYLELFPAAYNTPESRYYHTLERDTIQAERALKAGGLALKPEE